MFSGCGFVTYTSGLNVDELPQEKDSIIFLSATKNNDVLNKQVIFKMSLTNLETKDSEILRGRICHIREGGVLVELIGLPKNQIEESETCGNLTVAKLSPGKYKIEKIHIIESTERYERLFKFDLKEETIIDLVDNKVHYLGHIESYFFKRARNMYSGKMSIKNNFKKDKSLLLKTYTQLKDYEFLTNLVNN